MASDLSSACTDEIFEEKEEGEISLEDVSSSEESHPHYRLAFRNGGCPTCMSLQQCSPWCNSARILRRRLHRRQDADHGKENRRKVKESSGTIGKQQVTSTLQEKNDEDLVPISSDSDMEVVGLPGNSKHVACRTSPKSSKVRKKKKKKRNQHGEIATGRMEEPVASVGAYELAKDPMAKPVHSSRSHHRDASSPRYSLGTTAPVEKASLRSPSRRYRAAAAAGRNVKSRSPSRRSRSPVLNHANPMVRRLSRKLRTSRRSSSRSPVRFDAESRESRDSAASPAHVDLYASKLLKKVRRLESVGTFSSRNKRSRSKEHSSLKEKLNNMMRNKESVVRATKTKSTTRQSGRILDNNNVDRSDQHAGGKSKDDEDEDIELLRRLALETKQKKRESQLEEGRKSSNEHAPRIDVNLSDDNDSEALELRMIALHSAVMNKHRNRVERGFGSRKNRSGNNARNESPLSLSFLDVTPVPDELSDHSAQSPVPKSLAHHDEPHHPEDMDLDPEVEREKDSMPYSPTDDLTTRQINVDEEPSIVASQQVAIIATSANSATGTSVRVGNDLADLRTEPDPLGSPSKSSLPESLGTDTAKLTRTNHSPERSGYTSGESLTNYIENPDAPYSPSKPLGASKIDDVASPASKSMLNFESPYSPTDAPINDPELLDFSLDVNLSTKCQNSETSKNREGNSTSIGDSNLVPLMLKMSMNEAAIPGVKSKGSPPMPNEEVANVSVSFFPQDDESLKFYDAIIDQLPEIDIDGSPLVPVTRGSDNEISTRPTSGLALLSNEPLYLQGLPDVTRDDNKIPTLVNKSLVPSTILKTNKQLQQPLPLKKIENLIEPSFKSAEMRPVSQLEIAGLKPTKTFKPIKLCPMMKRPQVIMVSAAAFNSSFGDDVTARAPTMDENPNIAIVDVVQSAAEKTENPIEPTTSDASTTEARSENPEKWTKSLEKHGHRKSPINDEESKSQSRRKSNSTEKVKAKSVDKYVSHSSLERSEGTKHTIPKRASSSPAVNERGSSRRRANNSTCSFDSPAVRSRTPARRNPLDSSSEGNASKTRQKKKTRRGGANRRNRSDKSRSNLERRNVLGNLGGNREAEKSARSSTEADESMSLSIETKQPKDVAMEKSAEKKGTLVNEEPSHEKPKNLVTESLEELPRSTEVEKGRRLSLDEDEEALRALLLASLPKRIKTAEVTPEATNPKVKTSAEMGPENNSEKLSRVVGTGESSTQLKAPGALPPASLSSSGSSLSLAKIDSSEIMEIATTVVASETQSSLSTLSSGPLTPRKRSSSVVLKNPAKKLAKKALPALASTRVVNNAKKYQNAMLQKRLNLQRASSSYNASTGSRNITLNNLKTYENARPTSPKITNTSSKNQRLVINLESDTDSDAEPPKQQTNSTFKPSDTSTTQQQKPLAIPTTDFEKSLEQFLKDQRKKTESNLATTSTTTNSSVTTNLTKSPAPSNAVPEDLGIYTTPLAVRRHLPVSQQEEYRRLKQQIIERERQMLQKNLESGVSSGNTNMRSPCTPPGPLSPASPIAATILAKSHAQRISAHVVGASAGSSGEKIQEKTEGALSSAARVVKPEVEISRRSSLSSGAGTLREIARTESVSQNPATTSTPRGLNENSQSSRRSVGKPFSQSKKTQGSSARENADSLPASRASTSRGEMSSLTNLARTSLASGSTNGSNDFMGSLKETEMLTIQIPNDKIQPERSISFSGSSQGIASSTENTEPLGGSRTSAALRILSTEQLNNRFVKIQVERSAAGRKVTVAPSISDDLPFSVGSPASSTLSASSDTKRGKTVFCDNSLSLTTKDSTPRNENPSSNRTVEKDYDENSLHKSDASTFVLSENEPITGDESTASTFILSHNRLRTHENLESTRFNDAPSPNNAITKQTKSQLKEVWQNIRMDVENELQTLETLSPDKQNQFLLDTQENLITKRNMVLEDLTEMSGYLRQWEFEREIQTKLVAEVRRLREQLRAAESRLDEQRRQMNDMGPRVTKTHEKINQGRRDCYKLSRICQGLGNRVVGPNYKIPNTNARLLNEQLKEVAAHTRQLSRKKVPALSNALNSSGDVTVSSAMAEVSARSESPVGSLSERVNRVDTPNTSMSGTDNEEDTNEAHELGREDRVPIGESNDSVPEAEKDNSMDSFLECPHCDLKPRIAEDEEMRLREVENEGNDEGPSNSKDIDEPVHEIRNLSESNAPSKQPENPVEPEASLSSNETEIRFAPETNVSPDEIEALNAPETDIPSKETGGDRLAETNKNAWSLEPIQNAQPETTTSSTEKSEIHLGTLAQNVPARRRSEDELSLAGTSRSVSPAFSLPNDSPKTSKRRHSSYYSVLAHFKTTRNVDPNGILCPYELMGTCNDGDCQYYHLDPARQCQ